MYHYPRKGNNHHPPDGSIEETGYISRRNNYRLPASHRLNLGVNFNKKTKHGMRTWNISIYNAYNAMNPNIVYSKYKMDTTYTTMISTKVFIMEIPGRRKLKLSSRK